MNRRRSLFILGSVLLCPGPVEELQAVVGGVYGPAGVRGQARRVSRRTARRTSRRMNRRQEAAEAAMTTTVVTAPATAGLPIGTRVSALPTGCASLTVNGLTYFQCGGVYYQPQYSGPNLVYVVVMPPR